MTIHRELSALEDGMNVQHCQLFENACKNSAVSVFEQKVNLGPSRANNGFQLIAIAE